MIWSIAWKNVWRNRKRSLVVIVAVALGIISAMFLVGVMEGWTKQRLNDAIYNEVSHLQIHNTEYIKNEEIDLTINDLDVLASCLDTISEIAGWTKRTKIVAMINTPWANTGTMIYGIYPEKEIQITEIHQKIVPGGGRYINQLNPGDILIGDKTAEILKLKHFIITDSTLEKLRNENVTESVLQKLNTIKDVRYRSPKDFREALKKDFTRKELDQFGQLVMEQALDYKIKNKIQVTISDKNGNPVQGIFRVCGIYKTTNSGFDQANVFVNATELAKLYGGDEILVHEIAILVNKMDDIDFVKEKLNTNNIGKTIVQTWKELAPDAAMMNDFMIIYYIMFIGIIMLALAFGIINTMLMAILERTKELGMLMAIGMNHKRVFGMIMLETVFLTCVGAVIGMISGWIIMTVLGNTGIHFSGWGEGFEAIGFAAKVYPVVTFNFMTLTTIMVMVTAIVSSVWPARKALKLNPVEALRTE